MENIASLGKTTEPMCLFSSYLTQNNMMAEDENVTVSAFRKKMNGLRKTGPVTVRILPSPSHIIV